VRCAGAIEPVIGHLKEDHRMGRTNLIGRDGDRINALLAAAGYNFSLLLRSQPRRPPLAKIRPGRPAPAMWSGRLILVDRGFAASAEATDPSENPRASAIVMRLRRWLATRSDDLDEPAFARQVPGARGLGRQSLLLIYNTP
jgi:hypothetical protein